MKTAIYLRISDKDYHPYERFIEDDEFDESNSIDNQRILIRDFIRIHPDICDDVIEYTDDGFTGTNFNRPAFQRMMRDIRLGTIDTVIVKDLSRLGRDYIDTGDYLDQIFPLLSVRVIAVNSSYDSNDHIGDVSGMEVFLLNFINAMYSRDLSRKRKTSDRARWASGKTSVKNVPYGYDRKLKSAEWLIDEEAAETVRFIFKKAASGWTLRNIVDALNKKQIIPPGLYKKKKYGYKTDFKVASHENIWDASKVRVILERKEYYGNLVVHKSESIEYMYDKCRLIPKEEQIEFTDHHIPIISKELYDSAQSIFKSCKHNKSSRNRNYSLKYRIKCGNCRLAFGYRDVGGKEICYCGHKSRSGESCTCTGNTFSYNEIEKNVYELLNKSISNMKQLDKMLDVALATELPSVEEKIKNLESKLAVLKADRMRQYENYSEGKIRSEIYLKYKSDITKKINDVENEIDDLRNHIEQNDSISKELKYKSQAADKIINEPGLNQKMAKHFIKEVYVHDIDKIEISYTYDDLISKLLERNNGLLNKYFPETLQTLF